MDEFDPLAREGRVKALGLDIKKAATALSKNPSTASSPVPSRSIAGGGGGDIDIGTSLNFSSKHDVASPFADGEDDTTPPTQQQQQEITFTEDDWGALGSQDVDAKISKQQKRLLGFSSTRGRPIGESDFLGITTSEVSSRGDGDDDIVTSHHKKDDDHGAADRHHRHTIDADAGESRVPALEDEDSQLEVHRKKTIYVLYKGEETPISWFEEMALDDVKDALLCACDAMMDSEFVLKQILRRLSDSEWDSHSRCRTINLLDEEIIEEGCVVGTTYHFSQFGELVDGQLYLLSIPSQRKEEKTPKTKKGGKGEKKKKEGEGDTSSRSSSSSHNSSDDEDDNDDSPKSPEAIQRARVSSIVGDRWRRIRVPVDPTLHVETQKAILVMKRGTNLLKHTSYGYPHLRQFQLSNDEKRLVWYSGAKSKANSIILIKEIDAIVLGQTTQAFMQYKLPALQHLSFSLTLRATSSSNATSSTTTLDLTCKDEYEFDTWLTGLKALLFYNKSRAISKEQLLSHSTRFKKALAKRNTSIQMTELPEVRVKGQVTLEQCIEMPSSNIQQLQKKLERLTERAKATESQVQDVEISSSDVVAPSSHFDFSALATSSGPSFELLYDDTCGADDEEMEIRRMKELSVDVQTALQNARNDLQYLKQKANNTPPPTTQHELSSAAASKRPTPISSSSSKSHESDTSSSPPFANRSPSPPPLTTTRKSLDEALWKIEVDVENIEDMLSRRRSGASASASVLYQGWSEWNANMSSSFTQLQDEVSNTLSGWFQSATNAASPTSRQNVTNRLF